MVLFECGGYTLNNGFDSGNLGRSEFVKKYTDEIFNPSLDPLTCDPHPSSPTVNAEINVWTQPDCAGTPFENGNRTWFYFSVKGGLPSHILRINVMNLNRQAKLYSQGMHPVLKIGVSGKWERAKDRPSYRIDDDNFVMSFVHRAGEDCSVEHFYAFTFPYTYRELQEYLGRLDRRFRKRMFEVQRKSVEENICLFVDQADLDGMTTAAVSINPSSLDASLAQLRRDSMGESSEPCGELTSAEDLYNEIYYCRELLTYSVERRRIDLLTITSYHGISAEREERLEGLFPENVRHRCHTFVHKKIVFLSSRVHPGETPASFVLNGFIRLLLDRKSQIAATLRRLYVFKIVPFLNPDGVCNGMYRSDTLGHNLNRVYTSPDPKTHPSIYAVRRLLRYYQYGTEGAIVDGDEVEPGELSTPESELTGDGEVKQELANHVVSLKELILNQLNTRPVTPSVEIIAASDSQSTTTSPEILVKTCGLENDENCTPLVLLPSLDNLAESSSDSKSESSARTPLESKVSSASSRARKDSKASTKGVERQATTSQSSAAARHKTTGAKKEFKRKASPKATVMSARYKTQDALKDKAVESMIGHLSSGVDFHNLYNQFEAAEAEKVEEKSNLFLYIDLHGHASKKGVFMYGNHMAHPMQAVECMLLPRLMSMNSHHFHFDACNFSERNMYHKGKRDGLSKEGSGRVAVYKSTGLIKCYTLECNYNTGKYVNVLPARGKDKAPRAVNLVPPKYTPAIFEEVGRALGASILDLTNSNPISRLSNSEFRTLQGLRNALRSEIEKTFTKNQVLLKAAKGKLKRLKNGLSFTKEGSSPSSALGSGGVGDGIENQDALKENRSLWTGPANRAISLRNVTNRAAPPIPARSGTGQGALKYAASSSTLYGKKERAGRKKGKVDSKIPFTKKENPVPLLNLVPVKRLKGALSAASDDLSAVPSTSSSDEGRTPTTTSSQSDEPGCSTASASTKVLVKRSSGIPVFKRPTALVTIASTLSGTSSVTYAVPSTSKTMLVVKAPSQVTTKISSVSGSSSGSSSSRGPSSKRITAETGGGSSSTIGGKLKTKRSLKPDALTVKRKKSRAKSVWH